MYKITKRMEISGAHKLDLPYESPCKNLHGHNWIVTVEITGNVLDSSGMIWDFAKIKKVVNQLEHTTINYVIEGNPTAEIIAEWIHDNIQREIREAWLECSNGPYPKVSKVTIQESEGNTVCYIP